MLVRFKVKYNGYRTPKTFDYEVNVPKGATELDRKKLIEESFKNNIKQEGILKVFPHKILD